MSVEIEAKMRVPELAPIRERLKTCAATSKGAAVETNTFFDTPDHSLLTRDQGLRLRTTRGNDDGQEKSKITFKGPRTHGQLKSREERELEVVVPADAVAVFEALGYTRVLTFEKRRESWQLADCQVELDELPHIGVFVEIEGPSEKAVLNVRQTLGLAGSPMIHASYIAMLMAHLQESGTATRDVRFESSDKSLDPEMTAGR